MWTFAFGLAALLAGAAGDDTLDIKKYKDELRVLTDGKDHYFAVVPFTIGDDDEGGYLFYGDGKTFWAQRRISGGRNGDESFDSTFWEPRVNAGYKASFGMHQKKWTIQCDERVTELKLLEPDEGKKVIASAKFMKPRWKRRAYALARDNEGTYYYVDRAREPENSQDFRVFRGPKGAVKQQQMVNVVNDSEGDIFITKAGKLRLVLDKHETVWLTGAKQVKLTAVPIEDNHVMIYTNLGAYAGEKLGTPCDDF